MELFQNRVPTAFFIENFVLLTKVRKWRTVAVGGILGHVICRGDSRVPREALHSRPLPVRPLTISVLFRDKGWE